MKEHRLIFHPYFFDQNFYFENETQKLPPFIEFDLKKVKLINVEDLNLWEKDLDRLIVLKPKIHTQSIKRIVSELYISKALFD